MRAEAYEMLKIIVSRHRDAALQSEQSCLSIMKDYNGGKHTETAWLAKAVDDGIPRFLLDGKNSIENLVRSFASKHSCSVEFACFIVACWSDVLGIFPLNPDLLRGTKASSEYATEQSQANWYYSENSKTIGPVTKTEIENLISFHQIHENTLVWSEGLGSWKSADKYFTFSAASQPASSQQSSAKASSSTPSSNRKFICPNCSKEMLRTNWEMRNGTFDCPYCHESGSSALWAAGGDKREKASPKSPNSRGGNMTASGERSSSPPPTGNNVAEKGISGRLAGILGILVIIIIAAILIFVMKFPTPLVGFIAVVLITGILKELNK